MEVLVREPPTFVTRPKPIYQHKIDDDVQMACEAQGTPSPRVTWRRVRCNFFPFFFVSWKLWKTLYGFLSLIGWTDGRAASASRPLPGGTWRIDSDQTPAGGFRLLRMSRLQRSGYIGSHCSSGHRRHHAPRSLQHHHRVDRILRQPRVASGLQRWIRLLSKIRYLVQSLS